MNAPIFKYVNKTPIIVQATYISQILGLKMDD